MIKSNPMALNSPSFNLVVPKSPPSDLLFLELQTQVLVISNLTHPNHFLLFLSKTCSTFGISVEGNQMIWFDLIKILQSPLSPFLSYPVANPTTDSYFQCYHHGLPSSPPGLLQHFLTSLLTSTLAPQAYSPPNSQNDPCLHHFLLLLHLNSPRGSISQESQYLTLAYQVLTSPPRCLYG